MIQLQEKDSHQAQRAVVANFLRQVADSLEAGSMEFTHVAIDTRREANFNFRDYVIKVQQIAPMEDE